MGVTWEGSHAFIFRFRKKIVIGCWVLMNYASIVVVGQYLDVVKTAEPIALLYFMNITTLTLLPARIPRDIAINDSRLRSTTEYMTRLSSAQQFIIFTDSFVYCSS